MSAVATERSTMLELLTEFAANFAFVIALSCILIVDTESVAKSPATIVPSFILALVTAASFIRLVVTV